MIMDENIPEFQISLLLRRMIRGCTWHRAEKGEWIRNFLSEAIFHFPYDMWQKNLLIDPFDILELFFRKFDGVLIFF